MDKQTFKDTCKRRGYGSAAQISAWVKLHKKSEYTEDDAIALYNWCDSIDWRTLVTEEQEDEDE